MDEITYEEAMDLFKLPRQLGETPEGEPVAASIGRFGPYVRYGSKFVSIRGDDPYTIDLERALELIAEKKIADANRLIQDFPEQGIQVLNGRYGPYVTNGSKNAKIPKDTDPAKLTLAECETLIANAPDRGARRGKKKSAVAAPTALAAKKTAAKKKATRKKAGKKKAAKKQSKKKGKKKTPAKSADPAQDGRAVDEPDSG
jgi:DNA topoisomerase-1